MSKLFFKIDGSDVIGLYDGSTDYVHRVTGEAFPEAVQLPDGCVPATEADLATYKNTTPPKLLEWDGTKIIARAPTTREEKETTVFYKGHEALHQAEKDRIATLTDAELDAEIASI